MQLAFPESFFAVQLSRCALACGARELRLQFRGARAIPYPRTLKTIQRFNLQTFNSCFLFERSLTFRFASLKLLNERFLFHIDLGFGVRLSASAFSLERR